jgi:hypothetical protein
MENYTTNKEISTKLNQYYASLGYCELSNPAIMVAIRKAEKAIKPKVKLDEKYNKKYYESSFLDKAIDYILKNHTFTLRKLTEPSFTITLPDVVRQLESVYEDQGYDLPPEGTIPNAVLRAERKLKPKRRKREGCYYYEESFLEEAIAYILKNQSFKLVRSKKYESKRLTSKYLNSFDLLVTSSSTLMLRNDDVKFEKSGWFNLQTLFNFLYTGNVKLFEEAQRETTVQRSLCITVDDYSDRLFMMELFSEFASEMLGDFNHIIIHNGNKDKIKELFIFYNILDFNEIAQRIARNLGFFVRKHKKFFSKDSSFANVNKGKVLFSLYKENVPDFVSNHEESSIRNGNNKQNVDFFKGEKDFWKQNL